MNERRRTRASFTRTLEKICARLDKNPCVTVKWHSRFPKTDERSDVRALSLWVVGSYARGAPDCGDLDIVLDVAVEKGRATIGKRVGTAFFNSLPDVRIYGGTPSENESNADFQEAVLVWQGQGFRWKSAIDAIPEDPTAGRFSRPTDRLPFRTEQLDPDAPLKVIVEMEATGLISWEFTPITDLVPVSPEGEEECEMDRLATHTWGAKSKRLLPYLMAYFRRSAQWPRPLLRSSLDNRSFLIGGAIVVVGRPGVPIHELEKITTSEIVVVPHITARGPNGIWSIYKGAKLPAVVASPGLAAYFLIDKCGQPEIQIHPTLVWVTAAGYRLRPPQWK